MAVSLNPPELGFRRPFTHEVTQTLRLGNHSGHPVAFKVKTTAPKQYCVRPNSGRIEVNSEVEVQVLLQAMREEPPSDARCRDKFLVQSIAITPDKDIGNVATIWQNAEKTSRDSIEEKKIRVVFLPSDGTLLTPNQKQTNGLISRDDVPPSYGAGTPSFSSPAQEAVTPSARAADDLRFVDGNGATSSTAHSGAIESVDGRKSTNIVASSSVQANNEDGDRRLDQANQRNAGLTSQMDAQGLRQRKSDGVVQDARERITAGTVGSGIQDQLTGGVPVQIVAALCLLSFLLAYFFF